MTKRPGSPWRYPAFRRALAGRSISTAGGWMQTVAAGWLVYDLTGSAAAVGVLTLLSRGPAIVLSTYGGELADRYDRRRLAVIYYAIQAVAAGLLAIGDLLGEVAVTEVYAATGVIGVAGALARPVTQQVVTATVPPDLARRATGLGSVAYNLARLVGPAVGGVVVAALGAGVAFGLNALSFVAVILAMLSLPAAVGAAPDTHLRLRAALSEVRGNRFLRYLLVGAVMFAVFVGPIQELAPAIAKRHSDGAHVLGFMLAALGVGGLLGNVIRPRLERRGVSENRMLAGALVVCGLCMVALAGADTVAVVIAILVVCGTAWDVLYVVALTGVQFADPRMSGLMTGLFFTATVGGFTVGALLMGGVFDLLGVSWGLAFSGVIIALLGPLSVGFRRPVAPPATAVRSG